MTYFLLTIAIAAAVGLLAYRIKIPGGFMVGAIFGAAALSIGTGMAFMPVAAKTGAQIAAGAFIGSTIKRSDLAGFRRLAAPMTLVYSIMLLLNLAMGYIIYRTTSLDIITSFMCAVPGGLSDIPIIAADMGADAAQVAVVQFFRMVVAIALFPAVIAQLSRSEEQRDDAASAPPSADLATAKQGCGRQEVLRFFETAAIAVAAGLFGKWTGVPAGALMFAVIAVAAHKIMTGRAYLPKWVKRTAQIFSGAYIGSSIVAEDLAQLDALLFPTVLVIVGYILNCLIIGRVLNKRFGFTWREGMLAATPAGASDMALIASDIGVHNPNLILMQVARLFVTVTIFPQVIHLVVTLLSA